MKKRERKMEKSKSNSRVDETYRVIKRKMAPLEQKQKQASKLPQDDVRENSRPSDRAQHRGNRHGRSEAAREAVLQAADDLLVENGFAGVTIEAIAARAGVGKQTIYRWWSSKTDVLMDAFLEDAEQQLIPPDLGDLGTDLRSHLRNCADFLSKSDAGAVFRALVGEAQHDKQLASRLRSQYLREQRIRDRVPLQRAMERGDLSSKVDVEMAIDQLMAPIYYRILVTGEPVSPDYTDLLVHAFLTQRVRIKH